MYGHRNKNNNFSLAQTASYGFVLFTNVYEHTVHTTNIIYILLHWGMIHGFLCLCRCEISKNLCCRNLAVEKAVSELPTECTFCLKQFPRSSLERHQKEECQDRYTPYTHYRHAQVHKNTFFAQYEIHHTHY